MCRRVAGRDVVSEIKPQHERMVSFEAAARKPIVPCASCQPSAEAAVNGFRYPDEPITVERFQSDRCVLSIGEARLARRAKQATPLRVIDAARQSQARLQPAQDATIGLKPL